MYNDISFSLNKCIVWTLFVRQFDDNTVTPIWSTFKAESRHQSLLLDALTHGGVDRGSDSNMEESAFTCFVSYLQAIT